MGWLKAIAGARWFPYALIGAVSIALTVFGWGYIKGYDKAETVYLEAMNKALERQLKQVLAQKELEMRLVLEAEREKGAITRRVTQVQKPAESCHITPACVQWYDNVLRATTPD